MDSAILLGHTDKNVREAVPVSETRATTPVFPPGRYGHRREPAGRRRVLPIVLAVLVLAGSALLTVRLYDRYGDPDYQSRIVGWSTDSATRLTVVFTVRIPQGGAAECVLRARTYDGNEVGRDTVTVRNPGATGAVEARADVATKARASVGDVVRCHAGG
jgi:hypothetical protein